MKRGVLPRNGGRVPDTTFSLMRGKFPATSSGAVTIEARPWGEYDYYAWDYRVKWSQY
jgi:hypothetical protein